MTSHATMRGTEVHGPFHYEQTGDPGAVGSGKYWLNTSTWLLSERNSTNTAWQTVNALTMPAEFSVSGMTVTKATETANTVWGGPTSGAAAVPTFRTLVAADLPSVGGVLLRLSGDQSITTATATALGFATEDLDSNAQHFTSAANLTGTLAKTASSAAVVGTSTLFTTELTVGQVISVPGTAAEVRVVTVITDDTHLTVNANFANTASGQTAARLNSPIVFPVARLYLVNAGILWDTSATGNRTIEVRLNGATILAGQSAAAIASQEQAVSRLINAAQWDYVEALVTQSSGGSINAKADQRTFFSAVPQ